VGCDKKKLKVGARRRGAKADYFPKTNPGNRIALVKRKRMFCAEAFAMKGKHN